METLKRTFEFGKIAANGGFIPRNLVTVDMQYKETAEGIKRFSVSANVWNSSRTDIVMGGQCLDTLAEYIHGNDTFDEILRLWKLYHLNDMHPECIHQAELGWREQAAEKVPIYTFTMTIDAIKEQNALRKRVLAAAQSGKSWETTAEEQLVLGLPYSVEFEADELDAKIAKYYKLKKTEMQLRGWMDSEKFSKGILGKVCPVCGYRYGHSWNYFPIPEHDEEIIKQLLLIGSV